MKKNILIIRKIFAASLYFLPFIFVIAVFVVFRFDWAPFIPYGIKGNERGTYGDSYGVLTSLFSALGFAGVVVTILMQGAQGRFLATHQRSLFKLEATKRAYEKARELLADHNNDREIWIRAGRLLEHVRELAAGVTEREHQLDLEVTHLEYRPFFSALIKSKEGYFFYGVATEMSLDEALIQSESEIKVRGYVQSGASKLDEASIYSVWRAGVYPDDYNDKGTEKFKNNDITRMLSTSGLKQYLMHTRRYFVLAGRQHEKLTLAESLVRFESSAVDTEETGGNRILTFLRNLVVRKNRN